MKLPNTVTANMKKRVKGTKRKVKSEHAVANGCGSCLAGNQNPGIGSFREKNNHVWVGEGSKNAFSS